MDAIKVIGVGGRVFVHIGEARDGIEIVWATAGKHIADLLAKPMQASFDLLVSLAFDVRIPTVERFPHDLKKRRRL
jgi:hypothetical protein